MIRIALILLLIGCTPQSQMSSQYAKQAQDQTQAQDQANNQGMKHAVQDVPITINCIQIFIHGKSIDSTPCITRGGNDKHLPGDDLLNR